MPVSSFFLCPVCLFIRLGIIDFPIHLIYDLFVAKNIRYNHLKFGGKQCVLCDMKIGCNQFKNSVYIYIYVQLVEWMSVASVMYIPTLIGYVLSRSSEWCVWTALCRYCNNIIYFTYIQIYIYIIACHLRAYSYNIMLKRLMRRPNMCSLGTFCFWIIINIE